MLVQWIIGHHQLCKRVQNNKLIIIMNYKRLVLFIAKMMNNKFYKVNLYNKVHHLFQMINKMIINKVCQLMNNTVLN